jgi:hypothetical protein
MCQKKFPNPSNTHQIPSHLTSPHLINPLHTKPPPSGSQPFPHKSSHPTKTHLKPKSDSKHLLVTIKSLPDMGIDRVSIRILAKRGEDIRPASPSKEMGRSWLSHYSYRVLIILYITSPISPTTHASTNFLFRVQFSIN